MIARPELTLPLTPTDKILEITGWICLALLWIITLVCYANLPEIIPTHFNLAGKADDHGHKMVIFFLPVIGTLMFVGMTVLNRYPHRFNYPAAITADNAASQYQNGTMMIRVLKLGIAIVFSMLVFMICGAATRPSGNLQYWFLPVMLAVILIPLAYFTIRAVKLK
jgi:uncharacterized membrane protein